MFLAYAEFKPGVCSRTGFEGRTAREAIESAETVVGKGCVYALYIGTLPAGDAPARQPTRALVGVNHGSV